MQAVKSAIKNTGKKPALNTEIYGPRSKYGFLYGPHVNQSECGTLQSHIIIIISGNISPNPPSGGSINDILYRNTKMFMQNLKMIHAY